jgi:hypothetical protein
MALKTTGGTEYVFSCCGGVFFGNTLRLLLLIEIFVSVLDSLLSICICYIVE